MSIPRYSGDDDFNAYVPPTFATDPVIGASILAAGDTAMPSGYQDFYSSEDYSRTPFPSFSTALPDGPSSPVPPSAPSASPELSVPSVPAAPLGTTTPAQYVPPIPTPVTSSPYNPVIEPAPTVSPQRGAKQSKASTLRVKTTERRTAASSGMGKAKAEKTGGKPRGPKGSPASAENQASPEGQSSAKANASGLLWKSLGKRARNKFILFLVVVALAGGNQWRDYKEEHDWEKIGEGLDYDWVDTPYEITAPSFKVDGWFKVESMRISFASPIIGPSDEATRFSIPQPPSGYERVTLPFSAEVLRNEPLPIGEFQVRTQDKDACTLDAIHLDTAEASLPVGITSNGWMFFSCRDTFAVESLDVKTRDTWYRIPNIYE